MPQHFPAREPAGQSLWSGEPVFLAAVAFASGVCAARAVSSPPLFWAVAAIFLWAAAAFFARRRPNVGFAVLLLCLAAAGALSLETHPDPETPPIPPVLLTGESTVVGHVIRDGRVRPGHFGGQQQIVDIEVESVETPEHHQFSAPFAVRMSIYTRPQELEDADPSEPAGIPLPVLRYGQRMRLIGRFREPRNYKNPGAWDYRGYLRSQGIELVGTSRAATVSLLPGFAGSRWKNLQARSRAAVVGSIHRLWPERQAALFDAMLIGVRTEIDDELKVRFQSTGTFHILVVSGMNVGILAFAVFWVLRRLRTGEIAATVATVLLAAGYAWLADLGTPIVRSVWTLAIYLLARLVYRQASRLNAVGTAALLILVWQPDALLDPSFQLTFLSVLAIAGIAVPWMDRTSMPCRQALQHLNVLRYDRTLPPHLAQFRLDLRMICERLERVLPPRVAHEIVVFPLRAGLRVWDLGLISLLMQFALALPMAWYFHRLSLLSPIANAVIVPLTGVLMPSAVLAVSVAQFSTALASLPAEIAGWALQGITGTVGFLGHWRVSTARIATPPLWAAAAALASVAMAVFLARRRLWIALCGTAAVVIAGAVILFVEPTPQLRPGVLEVTAIDVGQGDSLFIGLPDGRTMLLDAGGSQSGFDIGEEVVSSYLWSRGISRLDVVAYSHPHVDHTGGIPSVIRNFRPSQLWYGFAPHTRAVGQLFEAAREEHLELRVLRRDSRFSYGGADFEVLSPAEGELPHTPPRDEDVMALRITVGQTSALLIGDSPRKRELQMLNDIGRVSLLKVAHHGSSTSTCEEFLTAAQPEYAVISVGWKNAFGHPRPDVLDRLARHRVKAFRTDQVGATTFYLDGTRTTTRPGPH